MTCEECNRARATAGRCNWYSLACPWCGARLIQRIGTLRTRPRDELSARRTKVLTDWVAYGHSETELRALAEAKALPLLPIGGQDATSESEPPPKTKRR